MKFIDLFSRTVEHIEAAEREKAEKRTSAVCEVSFYLDKLRLPGKFRPMISRNAKSLGFAKCNMWSCTFIHLDKTNEASFKQTNNELRCLFLSDDALTNIMPNDVLYIYEGTTICGEAKIISIERSE